MNIGINRALGGGVAAISLCMAQMLPAQISPPTAQSDIPVAAAADGWSHGTGSSLDGKTNVERAIGKCVASVIGGAILGGLIGAAAGSTKTGVLVGTAVGAGACVIMMKFASKQDKIALREAQINAANLGNVQERNWTSNEGANLHAVVLPSAPVPLVVGDKGSYKCRTDNRCLVGDQWVPYQTLAQNQTGPVQLVAGQPRILKCRRLDTQLRIDDRMANSGSEAVCLVGDSWITGDKLKKMNIRDDDIVTI